MDINGVTVGKKGTYVIAEAGINHNGETLNAKKLIDAAAAADADAIKFQSFIAEELVTASAPKAEYQTEVGGESQREMLKQYEITPEQHQILQQHCENKDITFLSTPFESRSLELLDDLNVPAIKVGSGELTNHPFLAKIAAIGRPIIMSTGMSTMAEVETSVECIRDANPEVPLALLHCVSVYPTEIQWSNLRVVRTMQERFDCPVGFSDHTVQVETPGLAAAMGAVIVEKHLTLDRSLPGPDHEASLEPDEMARAIEIVRNADRAKGSAEKQPVSAEKETIFVARKSLHATAQIDTNEPFSAENVEITRPADGLQPGAYDRVLGRYPTSKLDPGDPITESHLTSE